MNRCNLFRARRASQRSKSTGPGKFRWVTVIAVSCACFLLSVSSVLAQLAAYNQNATYGKPASENPFSHVGLDQRLNEKIPLTLTFRDETGKSVQLGDYFGDKLLPIMIAPCSVPW